MKLETFNWLLQRVTAVFLLFVFVFSITAFVLQDRSLPFWIFISTYPLLTLSTMMMFLLHGFLGMKVIMEDYISSTIKRRILELFFSLFLIATFFAAFYLVLTFVLGPL